MIWVNTLPTMLFFF